MYTRNNDTILTQEAIAILKKQIRYTLTVGELAQRLLVSERTLQRAFEAVYGESVYATFKRMKIGHAQQLLLSGSPVKQVALATGYRSASAFVQAFKDITSLTPGEWTRSQAA